MILARHVLWLLPDPDKALAHWLSLLRPGGRLVLVEGRAGLDAYRAGERFVIHWHEDGDSIAHDPGAVPRAVRLPMTEGRAES